ncbi:hypothetical protein TRFO_33824 [Tritrichomonas foetus]|uniref:Uncharacterized protein n=1 Tax=Tritrichomonas foetus TaxID=1144522 RepID=A0A1J4JR16_9EUKA|nr:hypothetical protein TRFO_33824 [Tritrichomonas foetus]|eukprot:OHS99700.1 hypothetical protein TRFO_33824 [Tritrichomonas foetus]
MEFPKINSLLFCPTIKTRTFSHFIIVLNLASIIWTNFSTSKEELKEAAESKVVAILSSILSVGVGGGCER